MRSFKEMNFSMKKNFCQYRAGWLPVFSVLCVASLVLVETAFAQRGGGRGRGGEPGKRIEPKDMSFDLGVASIPDRAAFEKLSYQGPDVMRDAYLAGLEFVKFVLEDVGTPQERVYFMNTNNHRAHPRFMPLVGIDRRNVARGAITYLPRLTAPDQSAGLYTVDFEPNDAYSFEEISMILAALTAKMPSLEGKTAFHPLQGNVAQYEKDKAKYRAANLAVHLDEDLYKNISYLPLNPAESFGRLRLMGNEARPSPRDIVIYKTLPNQMPRVGGVITEVRQTPLSHVNLRAIQDKIPNAYIKNALVQSEIKSLLGKWVHFRVAQQGYTIEETTKDRVDQHFEKLRPNGAQKPERDLTRTKILPLKEIKFGDSTGYGVKTANVAALHTLGLPEGSVPDGYGIPFYFYDEFMKHNGLYGKVDTLLSDVSLKGDSEKLEKALKGLRKKIRKADLPSWMVDTFAALQRQFPSGTSIRFRSSTNNEDLPGFSGAGLYDSFTHNPDEGALSKTILQVFASLWNFRAFEEREFYRIDHKLAAMGVLVHPNYKGEKANGVAVTDDVLYETQGNYYINTQIGEDLVTNPDATSSPEEILLGWEERYGHEVVRRSTEVPSDSLLLEEVYLRELRADLTIIHEGFRKLYGHDQDVTFAMEIEYKVSKEGKLVIKQARPWVF